MERKQDDTDKRESDNTHEDELNKSNSSRSRRQSDE